MDLGQAIFPPYNVNAVERPIVASTDYLGYAFIVMNRMPSLQYLPPTNLHDLCNFASFATPTASLLTLQATGSHDDVLIFFVAASIVPLQVIRGEASSLVQALSWSGTHGKVPAPIPPPPPLTTRKLAVGRDSSVTTFVPTEAEVSSAAMVEIPTPLTAIPHILFNPS
jgi:hypothetical protein